MPGLMEKALRQAFDGDKVIFRGDKQAVLRRDIDIQLQKWRRLGPALERPEEGWIATVRKALGMSSRQLARRLDIHGSAVVRLEQSEAANTIRLDTLVRVAEALECRLVYAFVPQLGSLEETLYARRQSLVGELYAKQMGRRRLTGAETAFFNSLCGDRVHVRKVWKE